MNAGRKDNLKIDLVQVRQPTKSFLGNLAVWCIRQTEWGRRNGEYLMEVWDYDDSSDRMTNQPTLTGAMDERVLKQITWACLRMLGRKDLAAQVAPGNKLQIISAGERGKDGKRTRLESGGGTEGGSKEGEPSQDETDIMAIRRHAKAIREKAGDKRSWGSSRKRWKGEV